MTGRRLKAQVTLTGLPKGTFTVRVEALTSAGKKLVDLRRYHTCTAKKKSKAKKHSLKPKPKG